MWNKEDINNLEKELTEIKIHFDDMKKYINEKYRDNDEDKKTLSLYQDRLLEKIKNIVNNYDY